MPRTFAAGASTALDLVGPLMQQREKIKSAEALLNLKKQQLLQKGQETADKLKLQNLQFQLKQADELRQVGLDAQEKVLKEQEIAEGKKEAKGFGEAFTGPLGNLLQKQLGTGEVGRIAGPAKETALRAIKPYVMPDKSIKYLRTNEMPPPGALPYTTGMRIESDGKGGFKLQTGVPGTSGFTGPLGKKLGDLVGTKQFNAVERLVRITDIVKSFKPEWLQIPTRAGLAWKSIKAKLGVNLSDPDKQQLREFKVFKDSALSDINLYIKEITGAQMSNQEAKRIKGALPDPGEHWWTGDDPITFKASLTEQYKKMRTSIARYDMLKKEGLSESTIDKLVMSGQVISLEGMERKINNRGNELVREIRSTNPNIDTQSLTQQVFDNLKREFAGF